MAQVKIKPKISMGYISEALSVLQRLSPGRFSYKSQYHTDGIYDKDRALVMLEHWEVEEMVDKVITFTQATIQDAYDWGIVNREGK